MGTIWDDAVSESDPLDGFDVEEEPMQQPELPVPGYVPEPGDVVPGTAAYEEQQEAAEMEEDYTEVMGQVDKRMKVATYFRMVLDNSMFPDATPESRIAESRIRKFIREELEVLFGMRQATPAQAVSAQFTEDEVSVLKEMVTRLRKPAAPAPQFKPTASKPAAPAPQFKPVTAASVVPAPKKPPPPAPAKPAVIQPKAAATKPPAGVDPRIPPQYRADPTAHIKDGQVFVQARNEDGQPLWSMEKGSNKKQPVMKNVTPVARPGAGQPAPLPMPSFAQSNMVETQRAGEALGTIERLAKISPGMGRLTAGLMLHSLNGSEE